jgi:hypothetical protein
MEEESNDKRRLWEGSIEDRESSTSALSHLPKITSLKPALWILVVVSALFSLSIHFSAPLLTRYPHENLDFRYRVTVWVFGFHVATDQLVKLLASPAIDRLPGLPLMLIATIASIILRIVLPFMANVAQAGSIISFFIISFGIGTSDTLVFLPLQLVFKRVVEAEFTVQKRKEALDHYVILNYMLSNGVDIIANVVYDFLRQHPEVGHAQANIFSIWLSAGCLGMGFVFAVLVMYLIGFADQAMPIKRDLSLLEITWRNSSFWLLMRIQLMFLGVAMLFAQLRLTFPEYLVRVVGPGARFPLIESINPVVVVCMTLAIILVNYWRLKKEGKNQKIIKRHNSYWQLFQGVCLCAMGPLLLSLGTYIWPSVNAAVISSALCVFFVSVGEGLWSPQFASFLLDMAPNGAEALFLSLGGFPAFLVRFPLGSFLSWYLLDSLCPIGETCHSVYLWGILGGIAFTTPLIMALCAPRLAHRWDNSSEVDGL